MHTDKFQLEIIRNALEMIAEELTLTIIRTGYSNIVRDSLDFSTAVCDKHGRTLAQGLCTPMHMGAFEDALALLIEKESKDLADGDVFLMNDPYVAAGQHLPDIYVVKPVFFNNDLLGWAATLAHHSDVGGIVAGSNALGATEIWQEGLRLPILKFYAQGKRNETLCDIIKLNVRTPNLVMGDLEAQVAACHTADATFKELFERYGVATLEHAFEDLHNYAQALVEAEIEEMPDGVYQFTDYLDGIGDNPQPVKLQAKITISGNRINIDWTGSSKQVDGGINSTFPFTKACAYAAVRSVMNSDIPNCSGYTRAITVTAPAGTVVNPVLPGACGARGITGYRQIDCLFGALAQALPDRVAADSSGGSTLPTISMFENGQALIFCETVMGTNGGSAHNDGQEGVAHVGANQSNVPVEMIEQSFPIRIEEYGFVTDSAGAGEHRGGMAIRRTYRILSDSAKLNIRSDKRKHRPHGLFGGYEGSPSSNLIVRADGSSQTLPVMLREPVSVGKNDLFVHEMPSGGGYGDPLKRPVEKVLSDVRLGVVSPERAEKDYGVVINSVANEWTVDTDATKALRN
ncbi:hydantoinase B/oxoprolinase family protein [Pusillimonas sp. ANT_WB101]|uniref:hydantoinase B/oxoprolinase family protein n=1 Tax=Pusillimonas sp. ANT_WB101 TaxID=2597356 RepID=UPI0011F08F3B|nr:hydantoinase B/oxoprolinase family protein [Pusillimonas sp. ANT_WB101]KAA0892565.1 hydantoinase B/oxoprolinase family protein [Pusillimonas sp. ANT_WB101]